MKTRYLVIKSGYWYEDENFEQHYVDDVRIGEFQDEKNAIQLLKTLDPDCHFIERHEYKNDLGLFYDWLVDMEYGFEGRKWLHEFTEEELK